ncbi:MAG: choice-of-anchor D domain-containing protein, partial [Myxococcales bacterium]
MMKTVRYTVAGAAAMAMVLAGCSCDPQKATQGVGPRLEVRLFPAGTSPQDGTSLANDARVDFGVVKLNRGDRKHFALRNGGSAPMRVDPPTLEKGTEFKVLESLAACTDRGGEPQDVPIGDCSTFVVEYTPSAVGDHTDVLTIRSDDADREQVQLMLFGRGGTGSLEVCIASNAGFDKLGNLDLCSNPERKELLIDYGSVPMGSGDVKRLMRVSNVGDLPLDITSIKPAEGDPVDFSVEPPDFQGTVARGESVEMVIIFKPTDIGDRKGTIEVNADDPFGAPALIKLASKGDAARLCIEPNPLDFGNVGIGTQDKKTITLKNCGTRPLQITNLSLEGDTSFVVLRAPSGAPLSPTASVTVDIGFEPTTLGPKNARLRIASTDQVSPVSFGAIRGNGYAAPECNLQPAAPNLDFGAVVVANRVTKSVFFNNSGGVECQLSAICVDTAANNA